MECMNPFIDANLSLIRDMFDIFASEPENAPQFTAISFPEEQKNEDMGKITLFLININNGENGEYTKGKYACRQED